MVRRRKKQTTRGSIGQRGRQGTSRIVRYTDLTPNSLNPRRLFDKYKLDVLEDSIRANKILVPLTVYRDDEDGKLYILDGERRWRCAKRIETGEVSTHLESLPTTIDLGDELTYDKKSGVLTHHGPVDRATRDRLRGLGSTKAWKQAIVDLYNDSKGKKTQRVDIPINVVDPPDPAANMLYMFHTHNLREQWELMPTALSLQILMDELHTDDTDRLAELTKLSSRHVERCKLLLNFDNKYQSMMLDSNPDTRVKANLFIEMTPVLDLYEELPKRVAAGQGRDDLTSLFVDKYQRGLIKSVIHFRRVLEARDMLEETERWPEFKMAARQLVTEAGATIRRLFDPLVVDDKRAQSALALCKEFVKKLRKLKIEHSRKGAKLTKALKDVKAELERVLRVLDED